MRLMFSGSSGNGVLRPSIRLVREEHRVVSELPHANDARNGYTTHQCHDSARFLHKLYH
jgi:hypothetical protein